jgi:hypothetical protein
MLRRFDATSLRTGGGHWAAHRQGGFDMSNSTASPVLRTWALTLVVATLAAMGIVTPVAAAAPSNDDRGSATVVGPVPFSDSTDTSEATWQPSDPDCGLSGEGDATVWYSFTPSQAGSYIARTAGSEYDTTLTLTRKTDAGLEFMRCDDDGGNDVDSAIAWPAAAGEEYLLMVGGCCPGDRGHLEFSVATAPPRPTIRFTLAAPARLTTDGAIALHGRIRCQNVGRAVVGLNVRQDQGLRIVRGQRSRGFACGSRWSLRVANFDFRFNRSDIRVVATARAWNISGSASRTIRRIMDVD